MENGGAMEEKAVIDFTGELCRYAGESEAFAEEFLKRLKGDAEIYEEFTYYICLLYTSPSPRDA